MKALLRVDGGPSSGMGHLVRTFALAEQLRSRGVHSVFATATPDAETWLKSRGAEVRSIRAHPGSDDDVEGVRHIASTGVSWIVTDGYAFRTEYLRVLVEAGWPVVSFDDLAAWPFPSAVVVNGGLGARNLHYETAAGTRLLLGPEYLSLRRAFRGRKGPFRTRVRRILTCFGGADPDDRTGLAVETWATLKDAGELDVVVGPSYRSLPALLEMARRSGAVVHHDIEAEPLADLMRQTDIAIASAGMIACELCAMGVPTILTALSENQRPNALALAETGAAHVIEHLSREAILAALDELLTDAGRRQSMARVAARLIDGNGAERLADAILGLRAHGLGS
jgi:UDP-2,4-diacetamido-2,4,6-trideoxy-beta-L-altropyranose hydrolase